MEEKTQLVTDIFINPLLKQVFHFIDEKMRLDSKRKTWNLMHQETLVKEAEQKRQELEYKSFKPDSLKERIDSLFDILDSKESSHEKDEDDQLNYLKKKNIYDEAYHVPVSLVLQ